MRKKEKKKSEKIRKNVPFLPIAILFIPAVMKK